MGHPTPGAILAEMFVPPGSRHTMLFRKGLRLGAPVGLSLSLSFAAFGCKQSFDAQDSEASDSGEASDASDASESVETSESNDSSESSTSTGDGDGDEASSLCGGQAVPFGFDAGTPIEVGGSIIALESGAFMGSEAEDLIAIDYTNGLLVYLQGNGNALFPERWDAPLVGAARDFAIADVEDNGDLELYVHRTVLMDPPENTITDIQVYPVDPTSGTAPFTTMLTQTDGFGMEFIDLDGDARRDELVISGGLPQDGSSFHLDQIQGLDSIPTFEMTPVTGWMPWYMAVGDLNGDGLDDLAVSNVDEGAATNDDTVEIFVGNASTGLSYWATLDVGNDPRDLGFGDFDEDGDLDLALAIADFGNADSAPDSVQIWLGDGNANFSASASQAVGARPSALEVSDINCDGHLDLLVTAEFDNAVNILLGRGDGSFEAALPFAVGQVPSTIAIANFNGDDFPDLAVGNWTSGDISILLGRSD